jgi:hypothetical protein
MAAVSGEQDGVPTYRRGKYAVERIAWSPNGTRIIAHADNAGTLYKLVRAFGEDSEKCLVRMIPNKDSVIGSVELNREHPLSSRRPFVPSSGSFAWRIAHGIKARWPFPSYDASEYPVLKANLDSGADDRLVVASIRRSLVPNAQPSDRGAIFSKQSSSAFSRRRRDNKSHWLTECALVLPFRLLRSFNQEFVGKLLT